MARVRWLAACFCAGLLVNGPSVQAAPRLPQGAHLKCLVEGQLCVGMRMDAVRDYSFSPLGPLKFVYCGADESAVPRRPDSFGRVLGHGCGESYVAVFGEGRCYSSISVRDGSIARLSRDCRSLFDFSA